MASTIEARLAEANRIADEAHKAAYGNPEGTPETAPANSEASGNGQGTPDNQQGSVDYQHRYNVLKGKYDAEVPKLHRAVTELSAQVLASKTRSTLEDEGATSSIDLTNVKDEELPEKLREFKGEYPDVFTGMVEMMNLGKKKKTEKAPAEKPDSAAASTPAQKKEWDEGMYQVLSMKSPKWREINKNPEFLGWLSETDRYARKTRGDLLKGAYAAGDIDVCSNIFNDWLEYASDESSTARSNEDLAPPTGSPNISGSPANAGAVKPISRAEVEKFYADLSRGKYKGREKEATAMEARIEAAMLARAVV